MYELVLKAMNAEGCAGRVSKVEQTVDEQQVKPEI